MNLLLFLLVLLKFTLVFEYPQKTRKTSYPMTWEYSTEKQLKKVT